MNSSVNQHLASKRSVLGIIGGSGLYQMQGLSELREHRITTPYGPPSDVLIEARINSQPVFFLPRHGRGHRLSPSEVPFRANIMAMKQMGVTHLLAVSAVGIMQEHIRPGDMVLPDQIIDMTKGVRASSFLTGGVAGHAMFAEPFCRLFSERVLAAAKNQGKRIHQGGTYVCIEGPRFSSRAESEYFRRTMNPSVIGMTAMPEACLAREAELSYSLLALATDYDCWHSEEEDVSVEAVLRVLKDNAQVATAIVHDLAKDFPAVMPRPFAGTSKSLLITAADAIPQNKRAELAALGD